MRDRFEHLEHPKIWDEKSLCYSGNGQQWRQKRGKKEGKKGKTERTLLHLSLPFLRLFSFCTQWTDVPFTLLNSAIENIYIASEQQWKIPWVCKAELETWKMVRWIFLLVKAPLVDSLYGITLTNRHSPGTLKWGEGLWEWLTFQSVQSGTYLFYLIGIALIFNFTTTSWVNQWHQEWRQPGLQW